MINGKVSIIIPGRCEIYFNKTVQSVLERAVGDIEVIAIIDGEHKGDPVISDDRRVKIIKLEKSIGQRAAYNLGVRESTGEYVMKIDAHCLLSKGFDEALKEVCGDKDVLLPEMRRLDVKEWKPKIGGETLFMHFGIDMYCHYWKDYGKRPGVKGTDPVEIMTGQGSCWFCKREWNDYIGLLDEKVGSWGNVGIEISLRTWLCGGRQTATKKAWQAHFFRKDEGGFPYPMNGRNVARAHRYTRENYYFKDDAFKNQCRPFRWLIEKFAPIPQWDAYLAHGGNMPAYVLYYTDSRLDETLAIAVREQIERSCGTLQIYSVSKKPLKFGKNICIGDIPHCYKSMYEGIKKGLEAIPGDPIVYLVEHDVFYHPSHFSYIPKDKIHGFFNTNRYYWSTETDFFYPARGKIALSQGVAYKSVWLKHVEERLNNWESPDNKMKMPHKNYESSRPNVDVRHGDNLTPRGHYKKRHERGELENVYNLPGWGKLPHFLNKVKYHPEVKAGIVEKPVEQKKEELQVNTAKALHNKWRRLLPQASPIRCRQFTRKDLAGLIGRLGLKIGVEVGVRDGKYSEILCKSILDIKLSCVDPWDAYYHFDKEYGKKNYDEAKKRLSPYGANLIKALSIDGVKSFEDDSLDFVYIDGDHRFNFVMLDLILWWNKVRPGGIIAGHDYYRFRNGGVVQAVDVFTQCNYISEWFITDEREASFFFVKPNIKE